MVSGQQIKETGKNSRMHAKASTGNAEK